MQKLGILTVVLILLGGGTLGAAGATPEEVDTQLRVELVDGSSLWGTTSLRALSVLSAIGRVAVPLKQIQSFRHDREAEAVRLLFKNGDVLSGVPEFTDFQLTTLLGTLAIRLSVVRAVYVSPLQDGLVLH